MKVSLNEKTTSKVIELLDCFPEGTKLTHVINLALTELYNKFNPIIEEKKNNEQREDQEYKTK